MLSNSDVWSPGEVGKLARMLSRRSEQLEAMLNRIPLGIAFVDSSGILTFANRAFRIQHLNLPRLVATVRDRVSAEPEKTEIGLLVDEGALTVYRHEDGMLTLLSRAHETEEARDHAFAALERVSGHMAHRLNNLLTVVLSCTEMLQSDYGAIETLGAELAQIREAAMMASRVTQDLLTYSRGRPAMAAPVDVDRALGNMRNLLSKVAGRCELRLQLDAYGTCVRMADRDLETVLLHLVRNSAESITGTGGIITVRTSIEGASLHLSVTDNGPGIPPEVQHMLFEPFVTTKRGASGMGLAVSYGIAKRAEADIRVSGVPTGGTRVLVVLPITQPPSGGSIAEA